MTPVQLSVTNPLLPMAAPGAATTGTQTPRAGASPPARSAEAAKAPERTGPEPRPEQAPAPGEDAFAKGRDRTDGRVAGTAGAGRRGKEEPRPAAGKATGTASARGNSKGLDRKTNAPAETAHAGGTSFLAIVARLSEKLAQTTAPAAEGADTTAPKQHAAATIQAPGVFVPESPAGGKAAAIKAAAIKEVSSAKALSPKPGGPTAKSSATTPEAAVKAGAAAPQLAEAVAETAKEQTSAILTSAIPTAAIPTAAIPTAAIPTAAVRKGLVPGPAARTVIGPPRQPAVETPPAVPADSSAGVAVPKVVAPVSASSRPATGLLRQTAATSAAPAEPKEGSAGAKETPAPRGAETRHTAVAGSAGVARSAGRELAAALLPPAGATAGTAGPSGQAGPTGTRQTGVVTFLEGVESAELFGPNQTAAVRAGGQAVSDAQNLPARMPAADQIAETIRLRGARAGEQIVVQLHPPQLGRVRLTLQADGQEVRGVLEVDNVRALAELQREAPALANRLAEGGVALRRLDVQLSDPNRNDSPGSGPQHGADGGQGAPQREAEDRGESTQTALNAPGAEPQDPSDQQVADESINVWM